MALQYYLVPQIIPTAVATSHHVTQSASTELVTTDYSGRVCIAFQPPDPSCEQILVLTNDPRLLPPGSRPLNEHMARPRPLASPLNSLAAREIVPLRKLRDLAELTALEFVQLVGEVQNREEPPSKDPFREGLEEWLKARFLSQNEDPQKIIDDARENLESLKQIRHLRDAKTFMPDDLINKMARSLAYLNADYDQFARVLFDQLFAFKQRRDAREEEFLVPYRRALYELQDFLSDLEWGSSPPFITSRIKVNILGKLYRRRQNGLEEIYDLAGLRIVVANRRHVIAAVERIERALHHARFGKDTNEPPYAYLPQGRDEKDYESGYRALHLDLRKVYEDKQSFPVAEIQIMSFGIHRWGEIQRNLVYKSKTPLPEAISVALKKFCRAASDFIVSCEEGDIPSDMPRFNESLLNSIESLRRRIFYKEQIRHMQELMEEYKKRPPIHQLVNLRSVM